MESSDLLGVWCIFCFLERRFSRRFSTGLADGLERDVVTGLVDVGSIDGGLILADGSKINLTMELDFG